MTGSVARKECGAGLVAGYLILCRYHTTKGKLEDGKVMPATLDRPLPGIHTPPRTLPAVQATFLHKSRGGILVVAGVCFRLSCTYLRI